MLVGYRVKEAKKEEDQEEGKSPKEKRSDYTTAKKDGQLWSSHPHLEQGKFFSLLYHHNINKSYHPSTVGYFMTNRPPSSILRETHSIAIITATCGFIIGIAGIVCYCWSQQATSVSIVTSACIGACFLLSLLIAKPFAKAEKKIS